MATTVALHPSSPTKTFDHTFVWTDGSTSYTYKYRILKAGQPIGFSSKDWETEDPVVLEILEKIKLIEKAFKPGIQSFTIEASQTGALSSVQYTESPTAATPKTIEITELTKNHDLTEKVSNFAIAAFKQETPSPREQEAFKGTSFQAQLEVHCQRINSSRELDGRDVVFAAKALATQSPTRIIKQASGETIQLTSDGNNGFTIAGLQQITAEISKIPVKENVFIPIHKSGHFVLLYRKANEKDWCYYDSRGHQHDAILDKLVGDLVIVDDLADGAEKQADADSVNCGAYVIRKIQSILSPPQTSYWFGFQPMTTSVIEQDIVKYRHSLSQFLSNTFSEDALLAQTKKMPNSATSKSTMAVINETPPPAKAPEEEELKITIYDGSPMDVVAKHPGKKILLCNWGMQVDRQTQICSQLAAFKSPQIQQNQDILVEKIQYIRDIRNFYQTPSQPTAFDVLLINTSDLRLETGRIMQGAEVVDSIKIALRTKIHSIVVQLNTHDILDVPEFPTDGLTDEETRAIRIFVAQTFKEMLSRKKFKGTAWFPMTADQKEQIKFSREFGEDDEVELLDHNFSSTDEYQEAPEVQDTKHHH